MKQAINGSFPVLAQSLIRELKEDSSETISMRTFESRSDMAGMYTALD